MADELGDCEYPMTGNNDRLAYWMAGLGVLMVTALLFETARDTVGVWSTSSSFNHGFAIFPVVAYLIWERKADLAWVVPKPAPWALILVSGAAVVWLIGRVTDTLLVQQIGFMGVAESLVLTLLGPQVAWRIAFPLFFAWFAIPFGDFLVPPMQDVTALILVWGLELTGIPVYADGVLISIPSGDFEVAEACSGLRFFTASTALGALGANMLYRSWGRRLAFVALALTIPILANGFRAYGIVVLAHYVDRDFALGVDHLIYGWIFFSFITMILIAIGWQFREDFVPTTEAPAGAAGFAAPAGSRSVVMLTVGTLALVSIAPSFASFALARTAEQAPTMTVPALSAPWRIVEEIPQSWQPAFLGPDDEARWRFSDGENMVDVYIAYYARQRQGSEAVSYGNHVDNKTWRRAGVGTTVVKHGEQSVSFHAKTLISKHGKRLSWKTYWVDQSFTARPWMAKVMQARALIFGGTPAAAALVVSSPYDDRPKKAAETLKKFLADSGFMIQTLDRAAGLK
ncbi:exosortase A [Magnetospira sp. QH-2]|uniref:exosortase A n=1 Tax=Magnetospira sp. (strain QH-2) TaxID=1288970 RepID=UPI0003E80F8A|nr:exosortase A [Magnetospira sp. QH-2]CCQ72972.1 conserved membrane protein of unknown function [Transmembrane exosortase domain] [Magnetospira sp. QH-2]